MTKKLLFAFLCCLVFSGMAYAAVLHRINPYTHETDMTLNPGNIGDVGEDTPGSGNFTTIEAATLSVNQIAPVTAGTTGNIDGMVIGFDIPAAATFSDLTVTGSISVTGAITGTTFYQVDSDGDTKASIIDGAIVADSATITDVDATTLDVTGVATVGSLSTSGLTISGDWVLEMPDDVWPNEYNALGGAWNYPFWFAYDALPYFRAITTTTYDLTTGDNIPFIDAFEIDYTNIDDSECWLSSDTNPISNGITRTLDGFLRVGLQGGSGGINTYVKYVETGDCIDFNPNGNQVTVTWVAGSGAEGLEWPYDVLPGYAMFGVCSEEDYFLGAGFSYDNSGGDIANWMIRGGGSAYYHDLGRLGVAGEEVTISVGINPGATAAENSWGMSMVASSSSVSVTAITGTLNASDKFLGGQITNLSEYITPCMIWHGDSGGLDLNLSKAISATKMWWKIKK